MTRTRWVTACVVLAASVAHADAASDFGLEPPAGRVQHRLLLKEGHAFIVGGPTLLERADYYVSPGVGAQASYFLTEDDGVELRAAYLFSSVSAAANEVLTHTGLKLDAPQPHALVTVGWRHSFAFGKVQVAGRIIHFDVLGVVHGGALVTSKGLAPALGAAPGLLVRLTPRVFLLGELGALATWEQRTLGPLAVGFVPALSAGISL